MLNLVVLDRRDPSRNMNRFYVLSVDASLYSDATLVREWGRVGTRGQRRVELHESRAQALVALETWLRRKQKRGYRIRHDVPLI